MTLLALDLVACGSIPSSQPTPAQSSSQPSALVTPTQAVSSHAADATASPIGSAIPVDTGLLESLPRSLDGLERQTDPSVDTTIARDANLAMLARSFATALYIDPKSGDFAYVSLVRLAQTLSEEAYRDYRDSFDEAACAQAGGRSGTAIATLGGRQVDIGTCAGGVTTYHTLLDDGVILAVSALGQRKLGEKVLASLAPPGSS